MNDWFVYLSFKILIILKFGENILPKRENYHGLILDIPFRHSLRILYRRGPKTFKKKGQCCILVCDSWVSFGDKRTKKILKPTKKQFNYKQPKRHQTKYSFSLLKLKNFGFWYTGKFPTYCCRCESINPYRAFKWYGLRSDLAQVDEINSTIVSL